MELHEFEHQLAEVQPKLYQLTKKFTRSREDSFDLVQETMAKAWGRRSNYRENKNLMGWLYIIMRNTFINQYRKNLQVQNAILTDLRITRADQHRAAGSDESIYVKEVWSVLSSINPELSKTIKMYTSGYKYEEIALALRIPIGTVKSRIFLARQIIRNQLPGYR